MSDTGVNESKIRVLDRSALLDNAGVITVHRPGSVPTAVSTRSIEVSGATALAPVIEIDRLYEAVPGTTSHLIRALELLKQASENLAAALKCEDIIEADRFVQRVQQALPKLFACRSIGDGFGAIINALHFAFTNLHGTPLTTDQLNTMLRVLRELRARPVMSLEQGVQRIEELEERGLHVDPPEIGELLEEPHSS